MLWFEPATLQSRSSPHVHIPLDEFSSSVPTRSSFPSPISGAGANQDGAVLRQRVEHSPGLLYRPEGRSEDWLPEWIRQGFGIGSNLLHRLLLLCITAMVWRASRTPPPHQWRACHLYHVRRHDWRTVRQRRSYLHLLLFKRSLIMEL